MSIINTEDVIDVVDTTYGDPLDGSVFPLGSKKEICSFFDECLVSFYECLFIKI